MNYKEELKYNEQERDIIKDEIKELESIIIIESITYDRFEVNDYTDKLNRLKMRLKDVSHRIVELEKIIKNLNSPD